MTNHKAIIAAKAPEIIEIAMRMIGDRMVTDRDRVKLIEVLLNQINSEVSGNTTGPTALQQHLERLLDA